MTTLKVNVIRKPTIKVKVLPNFPSSVTATNPILLSRVGGNYAFSFDATSLSGTFQPLDSTLTALAALNSTAGLLTQTALDTFTKRTLTGTASEITVTDGDGVAGNPTISLPTVNANVGTFGSATQVSQVTLDAKGRATAAANVTVTPAVGSVTGLGAGVATFLATPTTANLAAAVTGETGTGALVFATSPALVTPALGTPTAVVLTSGTGLPISTGLTGAGTGVLAALAVNVGSAGAPVINGGALGTPSSGTLTNATGLPISTGVSGLGTNVATSLAVAVGSNNAFVTFNGNLGAPASGTATNITGLPVATGISGLGAGVATFLATPSSANLATAVTGETGSGALVFATSPALVTPALGVATATSINGSTVSPGHYSGEPSTGNAAAGEIGEYISANLVSGSAVSLTTGTATNVTSISLTAGDWDVWGTVVTLPNAATTYTNFGGWISTTSATLPTTPNNGGEAFLQVPYAAGATQILPVGSMRISLSGTTTVFLETYAVFAVNTFSVYGFIGARRVR